MAIRNPNAGTSASLTALPTQLRFASERTFAWIDKFCALMARFDRKAAHFMGAHYIVYALINLRHLFAEEKSQ